VGSAIKPIRFFLAIAHYECLCILGMRDLYRSYTKHHLHGRSHSIEYDHPAFRFGTPLSAVQFYIGIGEACGFLWTLESAAEVEFGEIQDAFLIFSIALYFYPVRRCSGFSPSLLGKSNSLLHVFTTLLSETLFLGRFPPPIFYNARIMPYSTQFRQ